jgi:CheY-like chemotaxis protein
MTEQKDSVPNRLLPIDDEPMIVATISDFLRRAGFEVTFTTVASDAIESVRRGRFALTIVDYAMPGLNGLEAAIRFTSSRPYAQRSSGHGRSRHWSNRSSGSREQSTPVGMSASRWVY